MRDFAEAVERIVDEHGAALHVLDMGLDLDPDERDPYTRAFLSVAATFAELEADIKRENTRQGMAAAKALGQADWPAAVWFRRRARGVPFAGRRLRDRTRDPRSSRSRRLEALGREQRGRLAPNGWSDRTVPRDLRGPRIVNRAHGVLIVNEWMAPYWSDTVTDKAILDPLTAGLAPVTFALFVRDVSAAYLIIGDGTTGVAAFLF